LALDLLEVTPQHWGVKVGVLALQGAFREHKQMLERLGAEVVEVRKPEQLEGLQGLVVPGGESTTIGKLAREYGIDEAVRRRVEEGRLAVWGTCAGAIWLAREIPRYPEQPRLGLMDIAVERNAFGRQVDSFEEELQVKGLDRPFHAVFIRAPVIVRTGPGVEVLARHGEAIVLVRQGKLLASSFHPELTGDSRLHGLFLDMASSPVVT
jgi:5'-phosphate synthase pdxT subunit